MFNREDVGSTFERTWNETENTVTTVREFDTRGGYGKALWRHNDGRTLLMTGVTRHRVPADVLREVESRYVKEQGGLEEGVDIYVETAR